MRVFAALLFSSAVVLAPALAAAQTTTAPTAPASQTAQATTAPAAQAASATSDNSGVNLDEIVCRNTPAPTGSRLGGGRECHSVRQWNQREKEAQDITRKAEQEGFNKPGG